MRPAVLLCAVYVVQSAAKNKAQVLAHGKITFQCYVRGVDTPVSSIGEHLIWLPARCMLLLVKQAAEAGGRLRRSQVLRPSLLILAAGLTVKGDYSNQCKPTVKSTWN